MWYLACCSALTYVALLIVTVIKTMLQRLPRLFIFHFIVWVFPDVTQRPIGDHQKWASSYCCGHWSVVFLYFYECYFRLDSIVLNCRRFVVSELNCGCICMKFCLQSALIMLVLSVFVKISSSAPHRQSDLEYVTDQVWKFHFSFHFILVLLK